MKLCLKQQAPASWTFYLRLEWPKQNKTKKELWQHHFILGLQGCQGPGVTQGGKFCSRCFPGVSSCHLKMEGMGYSLTHNRLSACLGNFLQLPLILVRKPHHNMLQPRECQKRIHNSPAPVLQQRMGNSPSGEKWAKPPRSFWFR